jgi:hypothetical protein
VNIINHASNPITVKSHEGGLYQVKIGQLPIPGFIRYEQLVDILQSMPNRQVVME